MSHGINTNVVHGWRKAAREAVSNWLFAGSLRAGQRAAAVMSLLHVARLNGLEPYAYLKDVLTRLPTQPAARIAELLPHHWRPATTALTAPFAESGLRLRIRSLCAAAHRKRVPKVPTSQHGKNRICEGQAESRGHGELGSCCRSRPARH